MSFTSDDLSVSNWKQLPEADFEIGEDVISYGYEILAFGNNASVQSWSESDENWMEHKMSHINNYDSLTGFTSVTVELDPRNISLLIFGTQPLEKNVSDCYL